MIAKIIGACALALTGVFLPVSAATAQEWPSQPITIVVANPPGGATDRVARLYAPELSERLGVPVIIENVGGAGGALGTRGVATAPLDGYTFLWHSIVNLMMAPLQLDAGYDPLTELEIVARPLDLIRGMGVSESLGVSTVDEFVALAQERPGELDYGSAGVGSLSHLWGVLFNEYAETELTHIPYSGGAPALLDLLGGRIDAFFDSAVLPHQGEGVTVLAIIGSAPHPDYPDIPLISEYFPGFEVPGWQGLYAPRGVDPVASTRVREAIVDINADAEFAEGLLAANAQPLLDDMEHDIEADYTAAAGLYERLVEELGIGRE